MDCKVFNSNEDYEKFKRYDLHSIASNNKYGMVLMPYDLFNRLARLDKAVEEACVSYRKEKEE